MEILFNVTRFGRSSAQGREQWRVVGSTDCNYRGIKHGVVSYGPFVLLEESLHRAAGQECVGKLPHAGLTSLTYLAPDARQDLQTAQAVLQPWDNFSGDSQEKFRAGGLLIIETGNGIVHEERDETPTATPPSPANFTHMMQLWVNPGLTPTLAPPRHQLHQPTAIPVVSPPNHPGVRVRVLCGKQFGAASPATPPVPLLFLHVNIEPRQVGVPVSFDIPAGMCAFVYVLHGQGTFGKTKVAARQGALLGYNESARSFAVQRSGDNEGSSAVSVTGRQEQEEQQAARSENKKRKTTDKSPLSASSLTGTPLSFLLVAGAPPATGHCKILGHGGAVLCENEFYARAMMGCCDNLVEAGRLDDFGKVAWSFPSAMEFSALCDPPTPDHSSAGTCELMIDSGSASVDSFSIEDDEAAH